jgi:hypothetical protein
MLKSRIVGAIYTILDSYPEGDERRSIRRQLRLNQEFVEWFGELFVAPTEDWKQYDYVQMKLFGIVFCQYDELDEEELASVVDLTSGGRDQGSRTFLARCVAKANANARSSKSREMKRNVALHSSGDSGRAFHHACSRGSLETLHSK